VNAVEIKPTTKESSRRLGCGGACGAGVGATTEQNCPANPGLQMQVLMWFEQTQLPRVGYPHQLSKSPTGGFIGEPVLLSQTIQGGQCAPVAAFTWPSMLMFGMLLFSASVHRRPNTLDLFTEPHAATTLLFGTWCTMRCNTPEYLARFSSLTTTFSLSLFDKLKFTLHNLDRVVSNLGMNLVITAAVGSSVEQLKAAVALKLV
jgi:hypothetical protein